jgi:ketosteroid isomerase-like protein
MTTETALTSGRSAELALRDPEALHDRFCEACNAGDLNGLLALYEPGAVIAERTGELTAGSDAIRDHIYKLLALQPTMRILRSRTVISGELAQSSSHWQCDATTPDGTSLQLEYHGSELSRRQPDGSWRIVIDNPWGASRIDG